MTNSLESRNVMPIRRSLRGTLSTGRRLPSWFLVFPLAVVTLASGASPVAADETRVLFVPADSLPDNLVRSVPDVLEEDAELIDSTSYMSDARARDYDPWRRRALRRLGPGQGAQIIVVAGLTTRGNARLLRVRYYHGRTGNELRAGTYRLRGRGMSRGVRTAVTRDLRASIARGPRSARPPAVAAGDGAENGGDGAEEPAATGDGTDWKWSFEVAAGFGFGQRSATLPMEGGEGRLSTSAFPAIHAALGVWWRADEDPSALRVGVGTRYYTSVGLQAEDQREDGTVASASMRAQNLALGMTLNFPLAEGPGAVRMGAEIGWDFRMLSSDAQLSMPTYTLSGPYARLGINLPIGDGGPVVLGVAPEVGYINSVSEEAAVLGGVSGGLAVGIEAQVRVNILPELELAVVYRGSHAFMPSERQGTMEDSERFGVLRATYRH